MQRPPSSSSLLVGAVIAIATVTVALGGCGARGPLDGEATNVTADAGIEASVPDAAPDAAPDASTGRPPGVVSCGLCVVDSCGDPILACISSNACRAVFQCVVTSCIGGSGGGLDTACLFKCASEDPDGAAGALAIFQCLSGTCGRDCSTVLGGLGGLGGFGGGGGGGKGPGGGGKKPGGAPELQEVFSPWPELLSQPAR